MTEIEPVYFKGQRVRGLLDADGDPRFVVADLAVLLGYRDAANASRILRDHHLGYAEVSTPGGTQRMIVCNEAGMNRLVLRSNAANAEEIQDWVESDVMPSIRKTGGYGRPVAELNLADPAGVLALAEHFQRTAAALVEEQTRRLALEGPAAHAETFRAAEGLRTIGDVANDFIAYCRITHPTVKVLHTVVWDHAHRVGLVHRGKTVRHNEPTSQAIRAGWATPHRVEYDTRTTGTRTKVTTRLTPRGEARLWDAMVAFVLANGTLDIAPKAIAS